MSEDDTFDALCRPPTEDQIKFGRGVWVYCIQHCRPHLTGWCTVSNNDKIKLDATIQQEAYAECKKRNFYLYKDYP